MERKDWTLLVIASAKGEPLSPVQLQKSLFLIGENVPGLKGAGFYEFEPYDYGPFCAEVYQDADRLALDGLVRIARDHTKPYREYFATPTGLSCAAELRSGMDEKVLAYLERVVAWAQSLSFVDLVRAVYKEHPHMRSKSVFRDSA